MQHKIRIVQLRVGISVPSPLRYGDDLPGYPLLCFLNLFHLQTSTCNRLSRLSEGPGNFGEMRASHSATQEANQDFDFSPPASSCLSLCLSCTTGQHLARPSLKCPTFPASCRAVDLGRFFCFIAVLDLVCTGRAALSEAVTKLTVFDRFQKSIAFKFD